MTHTVEAVRYLLKPGWVALTLAVALFATACFTVLAPWQFGRHGSRDADNAAIKASFHHAPVSIDELLPGGRAPGKTEQWRQVTVTGSYLPQAEIVIRLRTAGSKPAFEIVTPMRTTDGQFVLLDRGYVRMSDDGAVPSYPPAPGGPVTVIGRMRLAEPDTRGRGVVTFDGRRQAFAIDSRGIGQATGLPLRDGYLQLAGGTPGVLGVLPVPDIDSGPFLSYAWQWLAFGAMAILGWMYFVRLEYLQRRAARAERRSAAGDGAGEPVGTADADTPDVTWEIPAVTRSRAADPGAGVKVKRRRGDRSAFREPPDPPATAAATRAERDGRHG